MNLAARVLILVLLSATPALATPPRDVRLSFTQPDTATRATFSWLSDKGSDPSLARVRRPGGPAVTVRGSARRLVGKLGWQHEVEVTGLTPATTYRYRVGGPGAWSREFTFRSAPSDMCAPVRLVVVGDSGGSDGFGPAPLWSRILNEIAGFAPDFVLHAGDLVNDGSRWKEWAHFLDAIEPVSAELPILYSPGNHDKAEDGGPDALWNRVFAQPANDLTGSEDFYFFTWGPLLVVALSTASEPGGDRPFGLQAAWLDRVLEENPLPWKVVFFHHPMYASAINTPGGGRRHHPNEVDQNAAFAPVLERHHVDFVFYGHNHNYERFVPLVAGEHPAFGQPAAGPESGTFFVETSGGGSTSYGLVTRFFCGSAPGSAQCATDHHFVQLDVVGDTLTFVARTTRAQDWSTREANAGIIESFTLAKPGVLACDGGPRVFPGTARR
jgi:predicted phosphodiesterase